MRIPAQWVGLGLMGCPKKVKGWEESILSMLVNHRRRTRTIRFRGPKGSWERWIRSKVVVSKRRVKDKRGGVHSLKAEDVRQLLKAQNYCCNLTGVELTPETASIDHIVPLSEGGSHGIENLQVVLREVNRSKGTLSQEDFVSMCVKIATHSGGSL